MRVALVGTDLAPVHDESGALERLLAGWAAGLAGRGHDVFILSVPDRVPDRPTRTEILRWSSPADLAALVDKLAPEAVVLNNRPAWQPLMTAPTVHLFHNWPDAWEVPAGARPSDLVGTAGAAAVSVALAETVAGALGRPSHDVGVVRPFIDAGLFDIEPSPEPGLVLCPNRLMVKKGIRELVAASTHPGLAGRRIEITDYLSPWTSPTAEHLELRRLVVASATCELIPPPAGRPAMAELYRRAEVVVCPSIRPEGLGLTAVEAQAAGVPVVSSGLGGLAESTLIPRLIADPNDPDAFAAAVASAADIDKAQRADLRDEARRLWSFPASLAALEEALGLARLSP